METAKKTWLITGASAGLGRALAQAVMERGDRLVATARNPDDLTDIVNAASDDAIALKLDVTEPEQVTAAVRDAQKRFAPIDVLINNAGYGYLSSVEDANEAAIRQMFEVNFFGLANLTRAVLPAMRARRKGWIINISSMVGRMALASSGYYSASKYAVEGLSAALHSEVQHLGINICTVQPGPIRTDFSGRSLVIEQNRADDYDATVGAMIASNQDSDGKQTGDPVLCAKAVVGLVDQPSPPRQLILGHLSHDMISAEIERQTAELTQWRAHGIDTDFAEDGTETSPTLIRQ